jgi:hypothetical protein
VLSLAQLMRVAARAFICNSALAILVGGGGQWAAAHPRDAAWTAPQHRLAAAYEWHGAGQLSRREAQQRLRFLRWRGFETVYLDLGDYLDVADQPETPEQRDRLRTLRRHLRAYVADASRLGLPVNAAGGGPTWTA